eukprot:TRINITY_DN535_c0_g1_i8.p3 TRINITY_DN535_c0_g1~~TRINITY_DN535_c0_g1_i8.p3  ORF type:complete len:135 (-),score=6.72 TRINITY_DN535_c0_g1_i8:1439-1843(-)
MDSSACGRHYSPSCFYIRNTYLEIDRGGGRYCRTFRKACPLDDSATLRLRFISSFAEISSVAAQELCNRLALWSDIRNPSISELASCPEISNGNPGSRFDTRFCGLVAPPGTVHLRYLRWLPTHVERFFLRCFY